MSLEQQFVVFFHSYSLRKAHLAKYDDKQGDLNIFVQKVLNDPNINIEEKAQALEYNIYRGRIAVIGKNFGKAFIADELSDFSIDKSLLLFQQTDLAVGDYALFHKQKLSQTKYCLSVPLTRENALLRKHPHRKNISKTLVANIDYVFVMHSISQPKFNPFVLDRFIVAVQNAKMKPVVCLNKIDLIKKGQQEEINLVIQFYERLGIEVFVLSCLDGRGINKMRNFIKGKQIMFLGHSGVGKSSLLNVIDSNINRQTGGIAKNRKGSHTTTQTTMYKLLENTYLIDAPGIREFDYVNLKKNEVILFFPEFFEYMSECRFDNCQHIAEKHCGVKKALENNKISTFRYISYQKILEENIN